MGDDARPTGPTMDTTKYCANPDSFVGAKVSPNGRPDPVCELGRVGVGCLFPPVRSCSPQVSLAHAWVRIALVHIAIRAKMKYVQTQFLFVSDTFVVTIFGAA